MKLGSPEAMRQEPHDEYLDRANQEDEDNDQCKTCHGAGFIFPEDGHCQYLGDGTIRCPTCGGL